MEHTRIIRELIVSAFRESNIKPDNFIYLLGGHEAWHIIHNQILYIFEVTLEEISSPTITRVTSQDFLGFNLPLSENDPDYQCIKDIYLEGLYHYLFLAHHIGNLNLFPDVVEKHFLYKLVNGYQPRKCMALVKCVKKRKAGAEKPIFEVKLQDFSKQFTADNTAEASQTAKQIVDNENLQYSNIIILR